MIIENEFEKINLDESESDSEEIKEEFEPFIYEHPKKRGRPKKEKSETETIIVS